MCLFNYIVSQNVFKINDFLIQMSLVLIKLLDNSFIKSKNGG